MTRGKLYESLFVDTKVLLDEAKKEFSEITPNWDTYGKTPQDYGYDDIQRWFKKWFGND